MALRSVFIVALGLAVLQVALGSEDLDWSDPQTALWAIARENSDVQRWRDDAARVVQTAAEDATKRSQSLVDEQIAAWKAPYEDAVRRAKAAGVDLSKTGCALNYNFDLEVETAVPWCAMASRAEWDAEVNKLQGIANDLKDAIVTAQFKIRLCAAAPGEVMQQVCRLAQLVGVVLKAQNEKGYKAADIHSAIISQAPVYLPDAAVTCTAAAVKRADFGVTNDVDNSVQCINNYINKKEQGKLSQ